LVLGRLPLARAVRERAKAQQPAPSFSAPEMQTFLPYSSFQKSAACLDNKRLGKQRVEAMQILNVLAGRTKGWKHHPAVLMWKGYEKALRQYLRVVIIEWKRRGYKNSMRIPREVSLLPHEIPPWIGNRRFHSSHRSNLLRKDLQHYGKMGWRVGVNSPRYWPARKTSGFRGAMMQGRTTRTSN